MVISVILITDEHDVPLGFEIAGNMEILGVTNYPARLPALQMAGNMGILRDTKNNAISVKVTSGGSRIFPRGGRQLPKVLLFFNFLPKTA